MSRYRHTGSKVVVIYLIVCGVDKLDVSYMFAVYPNIGQISNSYAKISGLSLKTDPVV
jgi:hypothetical protein